MHGFKKESQSTLQKKLTEDLGLIQLSSHTRPELAFLSYKLDNVFLTPKGPNVHTADKPVLVSVT
jgi:hypothetical protein